MPDIFVIVVSISVNTHVYTHVYTHGLCAFPGPCLNNCLYTSQMHKYFWLQVGPGPDQAWWLAWSIQLEWEPARRPRLEQEPDRVQILFFGRNFGACRRQMPKGGGGRTDRKKREGVTRDMPPVQAKWLFVAYANGFRIAARRAIPSRHLGCSAKAPRRYFFKRR